MIWEGGIRRVALDLVGAVAGDSSDLVAQNVQNVDTYWSAAVLLLLAFREWTFLDIHAPVSCHRA